MLVHHLEVPFVSYDEYGNRDTVVLEHVYRLVGAVCHEGDSMKTGHYTTFIIEKREKGTDSFYYHFLSDSKHCMVTEKEFRAYVSKRGYILLYHDGKDSSYGRINGFKEKILNYFSDFQHTFRKKTQGRQ